MRHHRAVFGVGEEAGFDEARFVITKAYTGGSDALKKSLKRQQTSPGADQGFCARELDYRAATICCSSAGSISRPPAATVPRSAVRVAAGPARHLRGAALQRLALPAVHWLDDRPVRCTAAARRERAMTASVIADSIVNLCGAIGLCVAMVALYRRDPKSPLTWRLLFMLGVAATLFLGAGARLVERKRMARSAFADTGGAGAARRPDRHRRHVAAARATRCEEGRCVRRNPARARRRAWARGFCNALFLCAVAVPAFRDLPPARGYWRRATAARCWHRKTAASAASRWARCW